jgi:hypothetical protein
MFLLKNDVSNLEEVATSNQLDWKMFVSPNDTNVIMPRSHGPNSTTARIR